MKKKILTIACCATLLSISSLALITPAVCFAEEDVTNGVTVVKDKTPGSGPNPFSDCGIGAALFPTIKPLAVISNVIWDIGTTAVTSATASPETCNGKTVTAAVFILKSYDNLAEETARGKGEHLVALLNIMEVNEADRAEVVTNIRTQMASTVVSDTYLTADKVEKANIYYSIVIASLHNIAV